MPSSRPDPPEHKPIAERFARALDHDDFETARSLLGNDCSYIIRDEQHAGPEAIIASYRAASAWAIANLDRIEYDSSVEALDDRRCAITFVDRITHRGESLEHRCRQVVTIDDDGLIHSIVRIDLPGERDAVEAFFTRVGLER
jgi:hypothetical protein